MRTPVGASVLDGIVENEDAEEEGLQAGRSVAGLWQSEAKGWRTRTHD